MIGWFLKRQGPHIAKLENHQKSKMDKEASNVININCNKKVRWVFPDPRLKTLFPLCEQAAVPNAILLSPNLSPLMDISYISYIFFSDNNHFWQLFYNETVVVKIPYGQTLTMFHSSLMSQRIEYHHKLDTSNNNSLIFRFRTMMTTRENKCISNWIPTGRSWKVGLVTSLL